MVNDEPSISELASIHPSAKIAEGVSIGPWTMIGANVEIGEGTVIGPHVVINGPTKIGRNNHIYQYASVGEAPQSLTYQGEPTTLVIGDNNVIREFVTLNRGTIEDRAETKIGDHNFFMAYTHVAHDCVVGNHVLFANNATLGGHVVVDDHVVFGGFSAVHQRCTIGAYSFVSGETSVVKDVLPYILVSGHPAKVYGLNSVGLRRNGFTSAEISSLKKAYSLIYRKGLNLHSAVQELEGLLPQCDKVQALITAIQQSTRGVIR